MAKWQKLSDQVFFGELFEPIIGTNLSEGCRHLVVATGYSSGAFVRHLLMENPDLRIELVIGMAGRSGIPQADHVEYNRLAKLEGGRFLGYYYPDPKGAHLKTYAWMMVGQAIKGYVGSPNLSWSGLTSSLEVAAEVDPETVTSIFQQLQSKAVKVDSLEARKLIRIVRASKSNAAAISGAHGAAPDLESGDLSKLTLSLLSSAGRVHRRSGLNWGQRSGRNPNEAYIPVPARTHAQHPGFFPPRGQRFLVETDDGETLACVIAQENDKAIETSDDNSLLGEYFRRRLGVVSGMKVELAHLHAYGRTSVEFSRIDEDLYLLDYSPE